MTQSENGLVAVALFTLVVPLMYIGFTYAVPIFQTLDLDTNATVNDTVTFEEDEWETGTLNNLQAEDSLLFPEADESGNWTSDLFNVEGDRNIDYEYDADMRDGNGQLIINAWNNGADGEPDETETVDLESGINSGTFDLSEYSSFEIVIELEETAGSDNNRPNLDYVQLDYDIVNSDEVGLSSDQVTPILVISYLAGILFLIFSIYVYVKISLES